MRAAHLPPSQRPINAPDNGRQKSEAYMWRELKTWHPFRVFGLGASFFGFAFVIIAIFNKYWLISNNFHIGLIDSCYWNVTEISMGRTCHDLHSNTPIYNYWQNAVIGLLVFGVAFGFLATVLSICGIITTTLSKKIYYYHSAGEIYFICAVSCTAAMMAYPVAINMEQRTQDHEYGYGYGLGWGAAFCYFASSMCMCLDDLVRTIVKGLCCNFNLKQ